jgi:pantothenate kinase
VGGTDADVTGVSSVPFAELVARADALARPGARGLLGICGPPGAGKSTLAARLVDAMDGRAVYVGMDGFHLAQAELTRLRRTERKGAPDTFDAAGYVHLLHRLRAHEPGEVVYAPEFRREIEEPVAGAVGVPPETPLVVTEGNYLLLWPGVRDLLDEVWFLAPDEEERLRRLVDRHRAFGRTAEQARERAFGSDQWNAELINSTVQAADLVLNEVC